MTEQPKKCEDEPEESAPLHVLLHALKRLANDCGPLTELELGEELTSCCGLAELLRDLRAFTALAETSEVIARLLHAELLEQERLEAEV